MWYKSVVHDDDDDDKKKQAHQAIGVITLEPIGSYEVPHSVALVAPGHPT